MKNECFKDTETHSFVALEVYWKEIADLTYPPGREILQNGLIEIKKCRAEHKCPSQRESVESLMKSVIPYVSKTCAVPTCEWEGKKQCTNFI